MEGGKVREWGQVLKNIERWFLSIDTLELSNVHEP